MLSQSKRCVKSQVIQSQTVSTHSGRNGRKLLIVHYDRPIYFIIVILIPRRIIGINARQNCE